MKDYNSVTKHIFVFKSIHDVIRSERIIKDLKIIYQIVPVPSIINSECGMCIEIDNDFVNQVDNELNRLDIFHKIY